MDLIRYVFIDTSADAGCINKDCGEPNDWDLSPLVEITEKDKGYFNQIIKYMLRNSLIKTLRATKSLED